MNTLSRSLVLASNSPRRRQLLTDARIPFRSEVKPTDESYPTSLPLLEVAAHIASQKAEVFRGLYPDELVLTADTVVIAESEILGKPKNDEDAFRMLRMLSGARHEVVTAVSLLDGNRIETVSDVAAVFFRELSDSEISYYIEQYKPFDKAGAYGVQEWIGMTGITRMEGSFYTVMGLPMHVVYQLLKPFMTGPA